MSHISEKQISIDAPSTESEITFIKKCFNSEDFHLYIAKEEFVLSDYKLLSYYGKPVGCAIIENCIQLGVNTVELSLYIEPKSRILSTVCIVAVIAKSISLYPDFDRMEFRVFSNNRRCIQLFDKLNIKMECSYNTGLKRNGEKIYLNYYSITNEKELSDLRLKIEQLTRN